MDVAAIGSALGGLKSAFELAKAVQSLKTDTEIRQATSEMLSAIIDARSNAIEAQETQTALLRRIDDLQLEVASFDAWNVQKERYDLTEISRGVFTYVLKPTQQRSEPVHCICASCYEHRQRSILQSDGGVWGTATLTCPNCKAEIKANESAPNYPFEPAPKDMTPFTSGRRDFDPYA